MPFPLRPCRHELRQIQENAFECHYCRIIFFGVERSHPNISRIMDSCQRNHIDEVGRHLSSMDIPVTHVDLGSMPQDVTIMKSKIEDLDKTLLIFSEILKDALQS